ncbi:MAG: tripartite tricarboxylate transporter TctB family protein [Celeribacter sp.]|jgi:putative tricarboxylic transport membrane protein
MSHTSRQNGVEGGGAERSPGFRVHRIDLWVAATVLAICAVLFAQTFMFDKVPSSLAQNVQPPTFPRLVLFVIAVIALIIPFEYHRKLRRGIDLDVERRKRLNPIVFATGAVLVVLVMTMPTLGALPALVLVSAVLPLLWGERRWRILVPFIVIFPLLVLFLFAELLQVTFPRGLIDNIFG